MEALVERLESADSKTVEHALDAASHLPSLSSCRGLMQGQSLPEAKEAAQVRKIRRELTWVQAQWRTGDMEGALAKISELAGNTSTLSFLPLRSEVHYVYGHYLRSLGHDEQALGVLMQAYSEALRGGQNDQAIRAAIELALLGVKAKGDGQRAEEWISQAEALAASDEKTGEGTMAELLSARAEVDSRAGRFMEAIASQRKAIERLTSAFHAGDPRVGRARLYLATRLLSAGKIDEAEGELLRAQASLETHYGKNHPTLARSYAELAMLLQMRGLGDKAWELVVRAEDIHTKAFGTEHPATLGTLNIKANVARMQGRVLEAKAVYSQVLEGLERAKGTDDVGLNNVLNNLSETCMVLGEHEDAIHHALRSLGIAKRVHGEMHPKTGWALTFLGQAQEATGDVEAALHSVRSAMVVFGSILPVDESQVNPLRTQLGGLLLATGKYEEARTVLEQASQTARELKRDDYIVESELHLASLEWEEDKKKQALRRVKALEELNAPPFVEFVRKAIASWRDKHRHSGT
jgi:tetratricopeptide (TPR) repeat protein